MHAQPVREDDRALRVLHLGVDAEEFLGARRFEPHGLARDELRDDLVGPALLARVIGGLLLGDSEKRRAHRGGADRLPAKKPHPELRETPRPCSVQRRPYGAFGLNTAAPTAGTSWR